MRSVSPTRKLPFSKHTSYPTAASERKFKPGELDNGTRVNHRNADKALNDKKNLMDNMNRKSMNQLDNQRKQLEKSMLAYSEKMKSISNSRTNELFREIHSRGSSVTSNDVSESQCRRFSVVNSTSGSTFSGNSTRSLPAQIHIEKAAHARRHSELRNLKGFSQVDVRSPILELRETPELRRSRQSQSAASVNSFRSIDNSLICQTERLAPMKSKVINARRLSRKATEPVINTSTNNYTVVDVKIITTDAWGSPTNTGSRRDSLESKVQPKIANKTLLPWISKDTTDTDSLPDSAYNSGAEDWESCSSAHSTKSADSSIHSIPESENTESSEEKMLLTVPKIHVRRGKVLKRKKSRKSQSGTLIKQSILKRVHHMSADPPISNRTC